MTQSKKIAFDALIFLFRIDNRRLSSVCGRGLSSWTCPSRSNETTAQISGSNHKRLSFILRLTKKNLYFQGFSHYDRMRWTESCIPGLWGAKFKSWSSPEGIAIAKCFHCFERMARWGLFVETHFLFNHSIILVLRSENRIRITQSTQNG